MRLPSKRLTISFLSPLLGLGLVAAAAATPTADERLRAQAQAEAEVWVEAHESSLPTTLEGIGTLPKLHRKAVLSKLSIAEKGGLWREHLQTFLTPVSQLSPLQRRMVSALGTPLTVQQRSFIRAALKSLGRMFDSTLTLEQRQSIAKPFCDSAKVVFTPVQGSLIFAIIGPAEPLQVRDESPRMAELLVYRPLDLTRAVLRQVHLARNNPADVTCSCHQDSLCDCTPYTCTTTMCIVTLVANCGCFSMWTCDGTCTYF